MTAAVEAGWTPPWWVLLVVVLGYIAVGALLFGGFLFCALKVEQRVRARMALDGSSGPETASMQERRAVADLGYEDERVFVERLPREAVGA